MIAFVPLFRNPHLQTIAAHLWPRHGEEARFPIQRRLFATEPGIQVLVQSQSPEKPPIAEIILVHGLEGSGQAGYIRSLSGAALRAGFAAHRFHMRTCGGTEHLSTTLYHAGLTSDLLFVLRSFQREGRPPAFLVGFSLGGNVVLKLAGELGNQAGQLVRGVCAISTPLDLAACAHRIGKRDNWIYHRRFVRLMQARLSATGRYRSRELSRLRSLIAIDDHITAPSFGFGDAAHYYGTQSAMHYLETIRIPTLLIHAQDDTFAPFESCIPAIPRHNPCIEMLATEHGGHLGFLGRRPHRFWLDGAILHWIARFSDS
jgi:uncharacterized protein